VSTVDGSRARVLGQAIAAPGLLVSPAERSRTLVELIAAGPPLLLPGVSDAIWARVCAAKGADAIYVTGAGVTNVYYGLPDIGLISFAEILDRVERIVEAVPLPVIVDADTGYGGLMSLSRAVSLLERAGASAIQIEDQVTPKRCGHFAGKEIVSTAEMQRRLDTAVMTRRDPNFLVIGRTDAYSVEGLDAAIERAERYVEAGADLIFIEAPSTVEEIREIPARLPGIPLLFNVVEGGQSAVVTRTELGEMGYRVVLYANYLLRTALKACADGFVALQESADKQLEDGLLSWSDRQDLVRLDEMDDFEDGIRQRWGSGEPGRNGSSDALAAEGGK
jgi:2,3-dimethylmalate lyase